MEDIDRMTGKQFEKYMESRFDAMGFTVERIGQQFDYGADLLLHKNGKITAVQVKRYKKAVGPEAIQQVVAAKAYYNASFAAVVTNSTYTKAARELAAVNNIVLWDRKQLSSETPFII